MGLLLKHTLVKGLIALALLAPYAAHAYTYKVLHAFDASHGDGYWPEGSVIVGKYGNIYGTTPFGGAGKGGVVFKYAKDGTYSIVHAFAGWQQNDGAYVKGGVIQDSAGNLIGATALGGAYGANGSAGTVFKIAPDGKETILHAFDYFDNVHDGAGPYTGPIPGPDGNLYGATAGGGKHVCFLAGYHCGVIYRLEPDGKFGLLYAFKGRRDSAFPTGILVFGDDGYLYGTAPCTTKRNYGIVFRIPPHRSRSVTRVFEFPPRHTKGGNPGAGLIKDKKGNFYGTTGTGGTYNLGTVFKVTPDGEERVLHSFTGADGAWPRWGNLVMDAGGNLYGTAYEGGEALGSEAGGGVVYQLTPDGTLNVLHTFDCDTDSCGPIGGVALDDSGNIYGTAEMGLCDNCSGTLFELVK